MNEKKEISSKKRDQFIQSKGNKLPFVIGSIAVSTIILTILYITLFKSPVEETSDFFGDPVTIPRSYVGKVVSMTEVEPVIDGEKITLPLDTVVTNNIVKFEVKNNEGFDVPIMAYITPSGRLFVGSSMCEPCRGRTFSLAGETLVCDACNTTYTIEEHKFISGSQDCGSYPPVNMNPVVEDGIISIPHAEVLNWRIRAY